MHRSALVLTTGFVFTCGLIAVAAQEGSPQLPEGDGKAIVQSTCAQCHAISIVTRSHQTKIGWEQTVQDMVGRGAVVSDDDMPIIAQYLAANFGALNVNTATADQLQSFLGFTDKEAQAIIAYREANGKIKNYDQLAKVPGLDPDKIDKKHDLIAFAQ